MEQSNFSVAIIDDEEQIRRALSRLLHSVGIHARTYASGQEFLSFWRIDVPDCIVVDLQMPNLDGLALLKCLRQLDAQMPAIVITAYDEPATREDCLEWGACAYLRKPLDENVLLDAISAIRKDSHRYH